MIIDMDVVDVVVAGACHRRHADDDQCRKVAKQTSRVRKEGRGSSTFKAPDVHSDGPQFIQILEHGIVSRDESIVFADGAFDYVYDPGGRCWRSAYTQSG
jgi:hypothetical protein